MASKYTYGTAVVNVGVASEAGVMPVTLAKIGKVYKDKINMSQDNADVTEHFEEGCSAPALRIKEKKVPKVTFTLFDVDAEALATYIGGTNDNGVWRFNGTETVANVSLQIVTKEGFNFEIPNCDVEAVIEADLTSKGLLMVNFTCTPMAVTSGGAFRAVPKEAA